MVFAFAQACPTARGGVRSRLASSLPEIGGSRIQSFTILIPHGLFNLYFVAQTGRPPKNFSKAEITNTWEIIDGLGLWGAFGFWQVWNGHLSLRLMKPLFLGHPTVPSVLATMHVA